MDASNIAIVRATDVIPFDGKIRPLSCTPYLCKETTMGFGLAISRRLDGKGPVIDYSRQIEDDYLESFAKERKNFIEGFLPYISGYNSVILFSLNGMVPDDSTRGGFSGNEFSFKNCFVIDSLSEHLDDDIISLNLTDTGIDAQKRGYVQLSENAVIGIRKGTYDNLPNDLKQQLASLHCGLRVFDGNIRDAIKIELEQSGRYLPLNLTLGMENGGIIPSTDPNIVAKEKECLKVIANIADGRHITQRKFYDMIYSYHDEAVSHLLPSAMEVQNHFVSIFLQELLTTMNASEKMVQKTTRCVSQNDQYFYNDVIDLIDGYGWDNYKSFVQGWNKKLEIARDNGTLATPQQIIDMLHPERAGSKSSLNGKKRS